MLIFLFTTLLTFFKLIIYSGFTQEKVLIKIVTSICLLLLIGMYLNHKAHVLDTALKIINEYKLKNKRLSFIIITTYTGLFIIGLLVLRIAYRIRSVDLREIYSIIITNSFFVNLINGILCILILIVYIILLFNILKYIKKHIIRLHLYYSNQTYYFDTWSKFYLKYSYHSIISKVFSSDIFYKKLFGFSISYHITTIIRMLHYIILVIVFIYDLIYNNYTIHVIFYILPYLFLYQIFIKISDFFHNLSSVNDSALNTIMYAKSLSTTKDSPFVKEDELLINGQLFKIKDFNNLIFIYLKYELDNYVYEFVIDGIIGFRYNYILDWKLREKI